MSKRILVIEDEFDIQDGIRNYLENAGYEVDVSSDGFEGIYAVGKESYDLILLDVMLPKLDGFGVLELLRKDSQVPVIMLTALGDEENQLKGFGLKVDDYIVKPFSMSLLLVRVEAVLRRAIATEQDNKTEGIIKFDGITVDTKSYTVLLDGEEITLTNKEYELFLLFIKHPYQVFTREILLDKCWGFDFFGNTNLVNVHIGNLRAKLGGKYLVAVRGRGYKMVKADEK